MSDVNTVPTAAERHYDLYGMLQEVEGDLVRHLRQAGFGHVALWLRGACRRALDAERKERRLRQTVESQALRIGRLNDVAEKARDISAKAIAQTEDALQLIREARATAERVSARNERLFRIGAFLLRQRRQMLARLEELGESRLVDCLIDEGNAFVAGDAPAQREAELIRAEANRQEGKPPGYNHQLNRRKAESVANAGCGGKECTGPTGPVESCPVHGPQAAKAQAEAAADKAAAQEVRGYVPAGPGGRNTIPGVGPDAPVAVNAAGGKQSLSPYRCDLLPPQAVLLVAEVLDKGARKYGENNWHKIGVREHLNHLLTHIYAHLAGDRSDDHLAHAACRGLMALERFIMDAQRQAEECSEAA